MSWNCIRWASIRGELEYVQGGLLSAEEADRLLHNLVAVRSQIFDAIASNRLGSLADNHFRTRRTYTNVKGQPKYDAPPEMLKTSIQCDSTIDNMARSQVVSKSTESQRLRFKTALYQAEPGPTSSSPSTSSLFPEWPTFQ